jgi:hypothetical protein
MRTSIKAGLLCLFATTIIANANAQDAKTFYVCSGTSMKLVPGVTTHTDYEWNEVNGTSNPIAQVQDLSITPTTTGSTYTTKKYTLSVKDNNGCWSEPDTFTVYVLPAITATISGNNGPYCANSTTAVTLTANVGALTLPAGVSANQFEWKAGAATVGTNSNQYTFNTGATAGTTNYTVAVSYSLPAVNGGSKLSSCNGSDNTDIQITTAPTTPTVTIQ